MFFIQLYFLQSLFHIYQLKILCSGVFLQIYLRCLHIFLFMQCCISCYLWVCFFFQKENMLNSKTKIVIIIQKNYMFFYVVIFWDGCWMEKKPVEIWLLIFYFIIMGILYLLISIDHILNYGSYYVFLFLITNNSNLMIFTGLFASIISFVIIYLIIIKNNWAWRLGIIFSFISLLNIYIGAFWLNTALYGGLNFLFLRGYSYILLMFIAPIIMSILFIPNVRKYFK